MADHEAVFTQSPSWAQVWERTTAGRMRPAPHLVRFDDGASAVLALVSDRRRSGTLVRSAPAGTYGGWVAIDATTPHHVEALTAEMIRYRNLVWHVSPFVTLPASTVPAEPDVTHLVDLADGYEAVLGRARSNQRGTARRAEREGVVCSIVDDLDGWAKYQELYRASLARWGSAARGEHPPRLFDALAAHTADGVRLWLATLEGRAVSGAIILRAPRHATYWHGAATEEGLALGATPHLLFTVMKSECSAGTRWFDFNPSGGLTEVRKFKERMGAVERPSPVVKRTSLVQRGLATLRSGKASLKTRPQVRPRTSRNNS